MKLSSAASLVLFHTSMSSARIATKEKVSSHPPHPALPIHPKFLSHIKCPYADKWLTQGPEAAARELGLDGNGRKLSTKRRLLEELPVLGSCTFTNLFSGGSTCMNFRGTWESADMEARCAKETNGVFATEGCMEEGAGWCVKSMEDGVKEEATQMMISPMADCDGNKMACETFMTGTFVADALCSGGDDESGETPSMEAAAGAGFGGGEATGGYPGAGGAGDAPIKCMIAPGAIGAAHQAGFSTGYSDSCPNTPAQNSPYMWPLKWAADTETKNMAYGSDEVIYSTRGRTFYSLDNNWKRSDTTFQQGVLRTIGQGPCEDLNEEFDEMGFLGCDKNQTDEISTMIHRGNLMYFISWKNDTDTPVEVGELDVGKIEECTMINLAVIGNIRPDWFLDKRGDDTDTQYLGDQHVFYNDVDGAIPKLVKQWRKKDFASQYFTMSMLGNPPNKLENKTDAPIEDNMHWPMILNIPGEGFGDDMLQVYRNHQLLTEEDDDLFMLVENYEKSGGVCADVRGEVGEGNGNVGPPVLEVHIPSNLEVEESSWFSNEYTFSPIWEAPARMSNEESMAGGTAAASSEGSAGKDITEVSDRVTIESCYDESTKSVDMSVHFHDIDIGSDGKLPWMAIGYRPTELCAMTPPDGGVTPIVLITQQEEGAVPQAHSTDLVPEAKALSKDAFTSMYMSMKPLGDLEQYMDVSLDAPMISSAQTNAIGRSSLLTEDDTISLHFKQAVDDKPEVMHLMYAIGMFSELGIHTTRDCFELSAFPSCNSPSVESSDKIESVQSDAVIDANEVKSSAYATSRAAAFAFSFLVAALIAL